MDVYMEFRYKLQQAMELAKLVIPEVGEDFGRQFGMNTGAQRSSATPLGAWTTTTPALSPKARPKKGILAILAAHRIPYAATASVAFPEDLMAKVTKAKRIQGTRFLHVLAPCPSGWKYEPDLTIRLARLAVESCVFPLVEIEAGAGPKLNYIPPSPRPVAEYLAAQGRFGHLTPEAVESIQRAVEQEWARFQAVACAPVSG